MLLKEVEQDTKCFCTLEVLGCTTIFSIGKVITDHSGRLQITLDLMYYLSLAKVFSINIILVNPSTTCITMSC